MAQVELGGYAAAAVPNKNTLITLPGKLARQETLKPCFSDNCVVGTVVVTLPHNTSGRKCMHTQKNTQNKTFQSFHHKYRYYVLTGITVCSLTTAQTTSAYTSLTAF